MLLSLRSVIQPMAQRQGMRKQLLPADRAGGHPMKPAAGECSTNKRRWLRTPCRAEHGASCHRPFRMSKVYTAWPKVGEIQGWKRVPRALHSHCWGLGKFAERLPMLLSCYWLLLQVSMSAAARCAPNCHQAELRAGDGRGER